MKTKTKGNSRWKIILLCIAVAALICSAFAVASFATDSIETVGEMIDIKAAFSEYLVQDTVRTEDAGYVGDMQYTVYYDKSKGTVKTGYEGTPVVIYTINHPGVERLGTDSNETIIQSMLDRGYIVIVLDYLNNSKAVAPAMDWSTQTFRTSVIEGKILTNTSVFPSGKYRESFVAPSGCNVLLNQVFWEIDKHSASGTLEKIVENWNSDFRKTKGSKLVEWVHEDGTRKAVQNDFDGNAPVWYNESGAQDTNGTYTYIKYTKAETITDCVDPDGSFIDMNLYINIVYPTSPEKEVPVYCYANCSGSPTTAASSSDPRPQSIGFSYNGYASVVFDYLWQPMARDASWGYYDGSGGTTKDHMNYSIHIYNDKLVNTAAMRYLRYLSVTGGTTYNFDLDAFGVLGNSKGGWFSFLGEKIVQSPLVTGTFATDLEKLQAIDLALASFTPDRYFNGKHGQTRYQEGEGSFTADGFTVKAGELQPWLTYPDGTEIISGCQLTYAQNGSQEEDLTEGHCPVFVTSHLYDDYSAAYGYANAIINICRELDVPLLNFELPLGHCFVYGTDMNWGVDAYQQYFNYANFFLNNGPLTVAYTDPMDDDGNVSVASKLTIRFAGTVALGEIEKITVASGDTVVSGYWSSRFGGTEWTFTPDSLTGGTKYTVTIPADLAGTNGNKIAEEYSYDFITEFDVATAVAETAGVQGNYYSFTAPALTAGNSFVFRFNVTNEAANIAEVYAVSSTSDTTGTLLGSVNLRGSGSYEIDITDYIAARAGEETVLLLKEGKTVGDIVVVSDSFDTTAPSKSSYVTLVPGSEIDGKLALKTTITKNYQKGVCVWQSNTTQAFTYKNLTGGEKGSADNLGRRYTIEFDIYDTISRTVQIMLDKMTDKDTYGTIDYNRVYFPVVTTANEWTHVEFTYVVYEADYGKISLTKTQNMSVYIAPDGDIASPIYFDELVVTEHVTSFDVSDVTVAEKNDGTGAYKAAVSDTPFAIYNGDTMVGEYSTWKSAFEAYQSGYTLKLQCDYTLTDADLYSGFEAFDSVVIDLNGYMIKSENTKNSLIWAKTTGANEHKTHISLKNGSVFIGKTPLISYESSTAKGTGKTFEIVLDSVYVGLLDHAFATEILSANISSVKTNVKIGLNDCIIDLSEENHAYDAFVAMPASLDEMLNISYTVTGGSIKLSSERWATVLNDARVAEFYEGENGYTKLVMPASATPSSASYLTSKGYAAFEQATPNSETNIATYDLYIGENSTRYGVIDEAYSDASAYPYVLFMDGNFKGAYSAWNTTTTQAAALIKGPAGVGKTAEILIRRDITLAEASSSMMQIGGTLVIDLGGNTITRDGKVFIDLSAAATDASLYGETNVIVKNGELRTVKSAIAATQSWNTEKQIANKTFNLTFEGVTFGAASGATGSNFYSIWENAYKTTGVTYGTTTNITLNDCVLDLSTNYVTTSAINVFSFSDGLTANSVNLVMNGGEIIANDLSKTTLFKTDSNDTVRMGMGSDGEYPTFSITSGNAPLGDNYITTSGEFRYFKLISDDGEVARYELAVNTNATDYGVVPPTYDDTAAYPFVVFDDAQNFIGAYANLVSAVSPAKNQVMGADGAGKTAYVVLRRDYTFGETGTSDVYNNYSQIGGTVVFDLGDHVLTLTDKILFDATKKTTDDVLHDTSIAVINGEIKLGTKSLIYPNHSASATEVKSFNFLFEDVTFSFVSASSHASPFMSVATGSGVGSEVNVDFVNCTFNLDTVLNSDVTLFNLANDTDTISINVRIEGGNIVSSAEAMAKITIANLGTNDTFEFVKGDDGEYTSLTLPIADKPLTSTFMTDEGEKYFYKYDENASFATYYLRNYGIPADKIAEDPAKYLSVIEYPFVIFEMNGNEASYYGSYATYISAFAEASSLLSGETNKDKVVKIVMLRDCTTGSDGSSPNIGSIGGTLILDLGGNTLTRSADRYVFDLNAGNTYQTNVVIENGTLLTLKVMFGMDHNANVVGSHKNVNYTFNNVTFGFEEGATTGNIMRAWDSGKGYGTKVVMTFNDCTFDLTNAPTGATLLYAADNGFTNGGSVDIDIVINGGKLIANTFTADQFFKLDEYDTLKLGKDADGNYMYVQQLASATIPAMSLKTTEGASVSFTLDSKDDIYAKYVIGESIYTEYGYIPFTYKSVEDYPFAVFDENGNLIGMAPYLYGNKKSDSAINLAKAYMSKNNWDGTSYGASPKRAYILMRRDYTFTSDETYDNLAQFQGTLLIDLGGYTLSGTPDRVLFPFTIKPWTDSGDASVFPTEILVKNGDIKIGNKALIEWAVSTGSANINVENKNVTFNFDNVDFGYISGGTSTSLIARYGTSSTSPTAIGNVWLNFNGCTFDMSGAPSGAVIINNNWEYVNSTVTVKGGKILANNNEFGIEDANGLNTSSLTFIADEEGYYTTLELPLGADAPSETANGGDLEFVKIESNSTTDIYRLCDIVIEHDSFVPKASITPDRDLIFNVYVPKFDALTSFTLDGIEYTDFEALNTKKVDGKYYYLISIPLASSEALRTMKMEANILEDGNNVTSTFSFDIVKYANKLLDNGTDTEKQLIRDILSYIRAAYAYFGTEDAEQIAAVNAILGDSYDENNAHTAEGSTDIVTKGLTGATFLLDATPTFRFYIEEGMDASKFTFYIDGVEVATEIGTNSRGTYIDIDAYAYQMCGTVTYKISGFNGGNYHIASYYEFATERGDAKLVTLVDRLWKYYQSARAYREQVLHDTNGTHKYIDGNCTICGKLDPDYVAEQYGTMTLNVPSSIYSNYSGKDVSVTFSKENYNGTVTYTTDNPNVFVENGKIFAKGTFDSAVTVTVTATTEYHTATATVNVSTYNNHYAERKIQYYEENIIKEENKGGTIFIGDSYFDGEPLVEGNPKYWSDFYLDYTDGKTFAMGISGSKLAVWNIVSERIVYPMEPSEIVVHIGHNDMHDGTLTPEQFVENLTALLNEYHAKLPGAKIYYCGIEGKKNADDEGNKYYESSHVKAPAVNAAIKALAETLDWLVYVDTAYIFYGADGTINKDMYPANDGSHPSLIAYDLMRLTIDKARGIEHDDVVYINNLDKTQTVNAAGKNFTDSDGNPLTEDFAMSGKLVITQFNKSNAHLQFRFGSGYRFVLWDQSNDGVFGAGYIGGDSVSDTTDGVTLYDATEGLVLEWTVILKDGKAYWYIGGQLEQTFDSPTLEYFNIGAECVNAVLYDIELSVRSEDEAAFNNHTALYLDDITI